MKAIKQAQTRNILDFYNKEDISYSRMNEMLNELADNFALGFKDWCSRLSYSFSDKYTDRELLEIYKKGKL